MPKCYKLASTLSTIFRPIFRLLGMESPQYREFIPGGSVRFWYEFIEAICISDPVARGHYTDRSLPVRRIRLYKKSSGSQHEFLVVEVAPNGSHRRYVKIERGSLPNNTAHDPDTNPARPSPTERPSLSFDTTSSSSDSSLEDDEVVLLEGWPIADQGKKREKIIKIEEVTFTAITLYDLVIMACALHDAVPVYRLTSHQCYWWANTILGVLKDWDHASTPPQVNAGPIPKGNGAGRFRDIKVHDPMSEPRSTWRDLFETERQAFEQKINIIAREKEANEVYKREAAEKVEAAIRRIEEAERVIEAIEREKEVTATRRAEEAERAKEVGERAREAAERAKEVAERAREAAEREKEVAERAREAAERAKEAAERAKEATEREKEAAERARDAAEEETRQLRAQIARMAQGNATTT